MQNEGAYEECSTLKNAGTVAAAQHAHEQNGEQVSWWDLSLPIGEELLAALIMADAPLCNGVALASLQGRQFETATIIINIMAMMRRTGSKSNEKSELQ